MYLLALIILPPLATYYIELRFPDHNGWFFISVASPAFNLTAIALDWGLNSIFSTEAFKGLLLSSALYFIVCVATTLLGTFMAKRRRSTHGRPHAVKTD